MWSSRCKKTGDKIWNILAKWAWFRFNYNIGKDRIWSNNINVIQHKIALSHCEIKKYWVSSTWKAILDKLGPIWKFSRCCLKPEPKPLSHTRQYPLRWFKLRIMNELKVYWCCWNRIGCIGVVVKQGIIYKRVCMRARVRKQEHINERAGDCTALSRGVLR